MLERLGIAEEAAAIRQRYAHLAYRAPVAPVKTHRVIVDCRTGRRTVETVDAAPTKPAPKPRPTKRLGLGPRTAIPARITDVITIFAAEYGIKPEALVAERRYRNISWPRQAAIHFLGFRLCLSSPAIGNVFGLDHTSVLYAKRVVTARLRGGGEFSARYHSAARAVCAAWSKQ